MSTLRYDARRRAHVGTASDGTRLVVAVSAFEDAVQQELDGERLYEQSAPRRDDGAAAQQWQAHQAQRADREGYWRAVYSDPDEWRHLVGLTTHVQRVEDGA